MSFISNLILSSFKLRYIFFISTVLIAVYYNFLLQFCTQSSMSLLYLDGQIFFQVLLKVKSLVEEEMAWQWRHWLLFQRTGDRSPAPKWWFTTTSNPSSRAPITLFRPPWAPGTYVVHRHRCNQNTHNKSLKTTWFYFSKTEKRFNYCFSKDVKWPTKPCKGIWRH